MDEMTNKPKLGEDEKPQQKPLADEDELDFDAQAQSDEELEEAKFEQKLSKPIQAHGEEIHILRWREPTAGDIERAGNPITVDFFGEKPSLSFNEKKMSGMISVLTQTPPSSVRQLTAGDWNAIAWKLVRFFMPRMVG